MQARVPATSKVGYEGSYTSWLLKRGQHRFFPEERPSVSSSSSSVPLVGEPLTEQEYELPAASTPRPQPVLKVPFSIKPFEIQKRRTVLGVKEMRTNNIDQLDLGARKLDSPARDVSISAHEAEGAEDVVDSDIESQGGTSNRSCTPSPSSSSSFSEKCDEAVDEETCTTLACIALDTFVSADLSRRATVQRCLSTGAELPPDVLGHAIVPYSSPALNDLPPPLCRGAATSFRRSVREQLRRGADSARPPPTLALGYQPVKGRLLRPKRMAKPASAKKAGKDPASLPRPSEPASALLPPDEANLCLDDAALESRLAALLPPEEVDNCCAEDMELDARLALLLHGVNEEPTASFEKTSPSPSRVPSVTELRSRFSVLLGDDKQVDDIMVGDMVQIVWPERQSHGRQGKIISISRSSQTCRIQGSGINKNFDFPLKKVTKSKDGEQLPMPSSASSKRLPSQLAPDGNIGSLELGEDSSRKRLRLLPTPPNALDVSSCDSAVDVSKAASAHISSQTQTPLLDTFRHLLEDSREGGAEKTPTKGDTAPKPVLKTRYTKKAPLTPTPAEEKHGTRHKAKSIRPVKFIPNESPSVICDTENVLVVYKPPYWTSTTPEKDSRHGSLNAPKIQEWLLDNFSKQIPFLQNDACSNGLCQRLDIQTSGPMIIAKDESSWRTMRAAVGNKGKDKMVCKEYYALMHGELPVSMRKGTLSYRIKTFQRTYCKRVRKWAEVHRHGEPAETHYKALRYYRKGSKRYTFLNLQIITGRTHQIRVHVAELAKKAGLKKCGLVGDYLYLPRKQLSEDREICDRVFLHARRLEFLPPGQQQLLHIECGLPKDLQAVLSRLSVDEEANKALKSGKCYRRRHGSE